MTTQTTDPNAFLMGSGGRSAKFENHGDTVVGIIEHMEVRQQTDFKSGKPLTWDDGSPRNQLVVMLRTDARDDEDDDGIRNLYVRGQMQKVVSDAVRKAGQRGLAPGGKLGVKFVSTLEPKVRGENGAKQYTAKYEPPVMVVDISPDGGGDMESPF